MDMIIINITITRPIFLIHLNRDFRSNGRQLQFTQITLIAPPTLWFISVLILDHLKISINRFPIYNLIQQSTNNQRLCPCHTPLYPSLSLSLYVPSSLASQTTDFKPSSKVTSRSFVCLIGKLKTNRVNCLPSLRWLNTPANTRPRTHDLI